MVEQIDPVNAPGNISSSKLPSSVPQNIPSFSGPIPKSFSDFLPGASPDQIRKFMDQLIQSLSNTIKMSGEKMQQAIKNFGKDQNQNQ